MALHDAAIKDEFFVKRKLAPNVDFWYVVTRLFLFPNIDRTEFGLGFVGGEWFAEFLSLKIALNNG